MNTIRFFTAFCLVFSTAFVSCAKPTQPSQATAATNAAKINKETSPEQAKKQAKAIAAIDAKIQRLRVQLAALQAERDRLTGLPNTEPQKTKTKPMFSGKPTPDKKASGVPQKRTGGVTNKPAADPKLKEYVREKSAVIKSFDKQDEELRKYNRELEEKQRALEERNRSGL